MFGNVAFASDFDTALIYLYNLLKQNQHQIQNHLYWYPGSGVVLDCIDS